MGGQAVVIGEAETGGDIGDGYLRTRYSGGLVIGLGCERATSASEVIALAERALFALGASVSDIACLASLDTRADEPAIRAAAYHFGVPLRLFAAETLESLTPRLVNPSDIVFAHTGCHGVAEGAALAAAGPSATLAVEKVRSVRATVAIAAVPGSGRVRV